MKLAAGLIASAFFILVSIVCANGQSSSLADDYLRQADEFRKNLAQDDAVASYEKAAAEFQKLGNTEKILYSYNQIGAILTRQDKYDRARMYLEKALSTGESTSGTDPLTIATTYIGLGVICEAEGKFDQSLTFHNNALSLRIAKLGKNHADVATSYGNIGNVFRRKKDFDRSVDSHLKAMKIREKVFGKTSPEIIESFNGLGNAYREKKDYDKSLAYFKMALANKVVQRGPRHKDLARFYANISEVYYLMGKKDQGDSYKIRSEEMLKN